MHIILNSQYLAQELRLVNKVVPAKPAIQILNHVLLRANAEPMQPGVLALYGTDLELGLVTSCTADVKEEGMVALPCQKLLDLVEHFPDAEVEIKLVKNIAHVTCKSFKSKLQAIPTEDFPLPPVTPTDTTYTFSAAILHKAVDRVRYAIAEKPTNYLIGGALLSIKPEIAACVALDGKRLSVATIQHANTGESDVMIPTKTLDALSSHGDKQIVISQTERQLFFVAGQRTLISRKLEGQFPSYNRVIPADNNECATVARSPFAAALRRSRQVAPNVLLTFDANTIRVQAQSADFGEGDEQVTTCQYEGKSIRVYVVADYILDFLNAAKEQDITIWLKDDQGSVMLTDGDDFLNVTTTMRSGDEKQAATTS